MGQRLLVPIRRYFAPPPPIDRLPDAQVRTRYPRYRWRAMESTFIGYGTFYLVINLITIAALDVVSKKAIGTAAGFIGLFGYIGRTVQAKGFGWTVDHYGSLYGQQVAWSIVFYAILACGVLAGLLLGLTWNLRPKA